MLGGDYPCHVFITACSQNMLCKQILVGKHQLYLFQLVDYMYIRNVYTVSFA